MLIESLNDALLPLVWGPGMLSLLFGTGVFLSLRCGFPQLLQLKTILRDSFGKLRRGKRPESGGLPPFQALTTALAGTVGTGNIAGVTGAILLGGPGAVFWMWVAAFFGMATKYAEIALAVRYREGGDPPRGGPMVTIERGLGAAYRPLAAAFALCGGLACFGIGNIAQSSEIAASAGTLFGAPPLLTGLILGLLVAAVLAGGGRRIGRFTGLAVPLMAGLYLAAVLPVLILHARELPALLRLIVGSAFAPRAAGGGIAGSALRLGFSRGIFSNEAGLGSAPMAHAAASCREPCEQAAWGVVEVFLDTFVICTLTALLVLLSGLGLRPGEAAQTGGYSEAASAALAGLLPGWAGSRIVPLCLLFFALSSIIGWGYYGELCWSWLLRGRPAAAAVFRAVFPAFCLLGALGSGRLVWELSDTLNGLMAIPNLISLLLLSGRVAEMNRSYRRRLSGSASQPGSS